MTPSEKDCMTCVMYEYHTYQPPKRIVSEKQRELDEVLTAMCNLCSSYSNWHDKEKYKLNDYTINKFKLKLKVMRNAAAENNQKNNERSRRR